MSGYAAIFHLDEAPVERAWLGALRAFLTFRDPDISQRWISPDCGLCHTRLRVSEERDRQPQIASLDDRLWIAGDSRVDDRAALIEQLPSASPQDSSAELILRAYAKWGEACVEHIIGDFSFVIWDAARRQVIAARDHLGVKPLFYAHIGQCLIISNTLEAIRQIPIVSADLNDAAVGDFLLFRKNRNPAATFFKDIQRVPVAHKLVATASGVRVERYWNLPIDEPRYFKRTSDYVDRFHELLRLAVRDRLPDGPLGIAMSGGLDSPAIAATAVQMGASVQAVTFVYDRLIPDEERYYAGLVAKHLGIPIFYHARDDEPWGWEPNSRLLHTPQPTAEPAGLQAERQCLQHMASHAKVFFLADGPDASLWYEWRPHLSYLIAQVRWGRLCRDLGLHFLAFKRVPLLPTLPRMCRERTNNKPESYEPSFPGWLNPEFESRLRLKDRWNDIKRKMPPAHPIRQKAYASFECDFPMEEDGGDGGSPGEPEIERLHPFWDLRLLRYLLTVPVIPWCREKHLIRVALKGVLPEAVRRRPKSPLPGHPYLIRARQHGRPKLPSVPELAQYVNIAKLPEWGAGRVQVDQVLAVLGLQYWLLTK